VIPPQLLVGIETADDAAVYQINDEQALIATTDFFMPIVDDPYDFGRIAATNAISDVYAMGGTPIMALALLAMPVNKLPLDVIRRIVEGGEAVCSAAGIPIAGGHTIDSVEPIYGLVVMGLVHPRAREEELAGAAGRRAGARQAARRRHLLGRAEEGRARRGRLRRDDRVDDEAQHARQAARRPACTR
jgi:selenide, water dikinase